MKLPTHYSVSFSVVSVLTVSKALKYYKSAKKSLNTAKVNFWLGKTYEQLDMKKEALKHIKISLKMDPKYPSALKKLKELQQ